MADAGNSKSAATDIPKLSQVISDSLGTATDVDYFKIPASLITSDSWLTLSFASDAIAGTVFDVDITNGTSTLVSNSNDKETFDISTSVSSGTAYYVKIQKGTSYSNQDYSFSINAIATQESGNNNSRTNADRLIPDVDFSANLTSGTDVDYFAFRTGEATSQTVSVSLESANTDNDYYSVSILNAAGNVVSVSGQTKTQSFGQTTTPITFTIGADGTSTQAGIYYVRVLPTDVYAGSAEVGATYKLNLTGTTDYNEVPTITIDGLKTGALGTTVEDTASITKIPTASEKLLKDFIKIADANTEAPNKDIKYVYIGLLDTDAETPASAEGYFKYSSDSGSTYTSVNAKTDASATNFLTTLSWDEFLTATYVTTTSTEKQKFYVLARDEATITATSSGMPVLDTSGRIIHSVQATNAGIAISTDISTLKEGVDQAVLTITVTGQPSADVNLGLSHETDITLSDLDVGDGAVLTEVDNENDVFKIPSGTSTGTQFTLGVQAVSDAVADSGLSLINITTTSSDAAFNSLSIPSISYTTTENIATFSGSDTITYSSALQVSEEDASTATYTITATGLTSSETLELSVASSGLTFLSDEVFTLTQSSPSATIIVKALDDDTVEGSGNSKVHTETVTHTFDVLKYRGAIDDVSISVLDNDYAFVNNPVITDTSGSELTTVSKKTVNPGDTFEYSFKVSDADSIHGDVIASVVYTGWDTQAATLTATDGVYKISSEAPSTLGTTTFTITATDSEAATDILAFDVEVAAPAASGGGGGGGGASTPVVVAPPVEEPETPVEEPETPVEEPETPVEEPETPVEEPETPVEEPETPVEEPETPIDEVIVVLTPEISTELRSDGKSVEVSRVTVTGTERAKVGLGGLNENSLAAIVPPGIDFVSEVLAPVAKAEVKDVVLSTIAIVDTSAPVEDAEEKAVFVETFVGSLDEDVSLEVKTINLSARTVPDKPIEISGSSQLSTTSGTIEALVLDFKNLPIGAEVKMDNVVFASISGPAKITGGAGSSTVIGDSFEQNIMLGADDDNLSGAGGNDVIGSAGGDDIIDGGSGDDIVFGGAGNDTLKGGKGNDHIYNVMGSDVIDGGDDDDSIIAFTGINQINGGNGSDVIIGGRLGDTLNGGDGDDIIIGDIISLFTAGTDTIHGGKGNDLLEGGEGSDIFILMRDDGSDIICDINISGIDVTTAIIVGKDFDVNEDKIDLSDFNFNSKTLALSKFSDADGSSVFEYLDAKLTIEGVATSEISPDNLII